MTNIFPRFEDIGYQLFESNKDRRYLGQGENNNLRFSRLKYFDFVIAHNRFSDLFKIRVELDKNGNKNNFVLFYGGEMKDSRTWEYSENGYERLKKHIAEYFNYLIAESKIILESLKSEVENDN